MRNNRTPTLVLMRLSEEDGRTLFAGDLYINRSLQVSVYHTRSAMLDWLGPIGDEARHAAAQAMDHLLACPETPLRSVPLSALPAAACAAAELSTTAEPEALQRM